MGENRKWLEWTFSWGVIFASKIQGGCEWPFAWVPLFAHENSSWCEYTWKNYLPTLNEHISRSTHPSELYDSSKQPTFWGSSKFLHVQHSIFLIRMEVKIGSHGSPNVCAKIKNSVNRPNTWTWVLKICAWSIVNTQSTNC